MVAVRVAPARMLVVGSAVAVAVVLLDIWLAWSMPWLGLQFDSPASGQGLVVARVFDRGPAHGVLAAGDVIMAIETGSGPALPLGPGLLSRTPYDLPTYAAFNRLFVDHRVLWGAIDPASVALVRADRTRAVVHPDRHRAVASLTLDFWAMALLAAVALLIGVGVWAFRQNDIAARMLLVACLGLMLSAAMMALFKGRELTLRADWVPLLWATEQFGEYVVAQFGLVALLWVYPRRFRSTRYLLPIGGLMFVAWLAGQCQWWPSPTWLVTVEAVAYTCLFPLAAWQWRASRAKPADRAALKILLLALLVPFGAIVGASSVPMMLGRPPLISSGLGLACIILLFYAGMALGVARYRLFELDRWWFEALAWGLGGLLIVLFDAALLWLNASTGMALGVAVAIAGWLYFPLRQWLWRHISPDARQSIERHLPPLIDGLLSADSSASLQANWRRLLEQIFAPLSIEPRTPSVACVAVAREGQLLRIPGVGDAPALELHLADKGQRLFTPADVTLARTLYALTQQAAHARRALDDRAAEHQARLREKELLLQDLHDGLGGMATNIGLLANLAQKEQDLAAMQDRLATIGELADASLAEIRGLMYSLDDSDADWPAIAADLRAYGRVLVEPHGLVFEMQVAIEQAAPLPDSMTRLNLARMVKEALTNIVKHAQARHASVRLDVARHELRLVVQDDGVGLPPTIAGSRTKSRGLGNLHRRAERLGGHVEIGPGREGSGTAVRLSLPVPTKYPASGDASDPASH